MTIDMDKIRNRHANPPAKKTFDKIKYLKLKDGLNNLRILPFVVDDVFYAERQVCYKCGPKGWKLVPKHPASEDDPIRQYLAELDERAKDGDDQAAAELKDAKPSWKVGMFVIDRSAEGEGPQFWEATNKCFNEILSYMADPDYGNISDPETGFDIVVDKTPAAKSAKKMVEYVVRVRRNPSKLSDNADKVGEWLKDNLWETQGKFFVEGSEDEFVRKVLAGEDFGKKTTEERSDNTTAVDDDADAGLRDRLNARRRDESIPF